MDSQRKKSAKVKRATPRSENRAGSTKATTLKPAPLEFGQPEPTAGHQTTDQGNGGRFAEQWKDTVRYVRRERAWYVWDGTRWMRDYVGIVVELAKLTANSILGEALRTPDPDLKKALATHAIKTQSEPALRRMIELASSDPAIRLLGDEFDRDPWLLNTLSGTLDLRTGKLHKPRPTDLITKTTAVAYDPKASAPVWRKHLKRVLPDPEVRRFLQRYFGYACTAVIREHMFLIAFGSGENGKSKTVEAVRFTLGQYAQTAPVDVLLAKHRDGAATSEIARLRNMRLVTLHETEDGARLQEARLKRLTGGDQITARHLYQENIEFDATAKLILSANHRPVIRGTDHAIWRRIGLVPFTVQIPKAEQDLAIDEKLKAEAPGILAWLVRGCLEWQKRGLRPPPAVLAATDDYRETEDTLGRFITERCNEGKEYKSEATPLYVDYTNWCEECGELALSQKRFGAKLAERGFSNAARDSWGRTLWSGLRLKRRRQ